MEHEERAGPTCGNWEHSSLLEVPQGAAGPGSSMEDEAGLERNGRGEQASRPVGGGGNGKSGSASSSGRWRWRSRPGHFPWRERFPPPTPKSHQDLLLTGLQPSSAEEVPGGQPWEARPPDLPLLPSPAWESWGGGGLQTCPTPDVRRWALPVEGKQGGEFCHLPGLVGPGMLQEAREGPGVREGAWAFHASPKQAQPPEMSFVYSQATRLPASREKGLFSRGLGDW